MAWVDDRIWCHPKFVDLSDPTKWLWVKGIAYSSGFYTKGWLTKGQQQTIGSAPRTRAELIKAGLWDERPGGAVYIHDWEEHNGARDRQREKDRERKRVERARDKSTPRPSDSPSDSPSDRRTLTVEGVKDEEPSAVTDPSYEQHRALNIPNLRGIA